MECGREAVYRESDLCNACYQWFWNWMRRNPTELFQRKQQIEVLERRMGEMTTPKIVRRTGT